MKFALVIGWASPSWSSDFYIKDSNKDFIGLMFWEKDSKKFKRDSLFNSGLSYLPVVFNFKAISSKQSK